MSHHLLIAGTGRAGTTFLVQLLGACGLDTGADRLGLDLHQHANAGLEVLPNAPIELPYVIKSPWSHLVLEDAIMRCGRTFDHLLIPVRDLEDAAVSRITQELSAIHRSGVADDVWPPDSTWDTWAGVAGGVTYSLEPLDQARILAVALHRQIEVAVRFEIPMTFLDFPRVVTDCTYAYRVLAPLIGEEMSETTFEQTFAQVADRSKVRIGTTGVERESEQGVDTAIGDTCLVDVDAIAMRMALASARKEMQSARERIVQLEVETQAIRGELASTVARADMLDADVLERDAALSEAARESQMIRAELASTVARADEREADVLERDAALQEAARALDGVLRSPSWRLTQPLRWIKAQLRRT